jgi:hypothetical protein
MPTDPDRDNQGDGDPLLDQVCPEPNPELVHQHDDREDALDRAIESDEGVQPNDLPSSTRFDEVLTA